MDESLLSFLRMIIGFVVGMIFYFFVLRPVHVFLHRKFGHCKCAESVRKNSPCACPCFDAKDCVLREPAKIAGQEIARKVINNSMEG